MKYLWQFLIIVAFSFVGELLHFLIPLPIPASIYGIVLLFVALYAHWIQVRQIRHHAGAVHPLCRRLGDGLGGDTPELGFVFGHHPGEHAGRHGCGRMGHSVGIASS